MAIWVADVSCLIIGEYFPQIIGESLKSGHIIGIVRVNFNFDCF